MKTIKDKFRKLDDQAKIYSLSFNKKDTSVFRLSTTLLQRINPDLLKQALLISLDKYKAFKVKVKPGFFWYYLVENKEEPIISKEINETFASINTKENNEYLFKLTYKNKTINIDFFHILTDGNTGNEFFKEIIYNYLELKYPSSLKKIESEELSYTLDNSYNDIRKQKSIKAYSNPRAYQLQGESIKDNKVGINEFKIRINELKAQAKEKGCSISELLISMLAYSLYETNYKTNKGKKPINICVPINLKKFFPSDTLSNFVSHMMVTLKVNTNNSNTFEDIISMVKKEFSKKLNKEPIQATTKANSDAINSFLVNHVPLPIKKFLFVAGSFSFKKQFTMTLSNLGQNKVKEAYQKYIKNFSFVLPPDWRERIRCGVCSYKNTLVISFGSNIQENNLEKKFAELLKDLGVTYKLQNNGINAIH